MGFITNAELAQTCPAFLVEAARLVVTEFPHEVSSHVGLLMQGDVAVVDADMDELPWVRLPSGSRVRISADLEKSTLLDGDGFFRVEMTTHDGNHKTMATRCPEGSAVVHLHLCRCKHWTVVHRLVPVRAECSVSSEQVGSLSQGDLLCQGTASSDTDTPEGTEEWVPIHGKSAIWRKGRLNKAPGPPLDGGRKAGFVLRVHSELGKLITLAKKGRPPPDVNAHRPVRPVVSEKLTSKLPAPPARQVVAAARQAVAGAPWLPMENLPEDESPEPAPAPAQRSSPVSPALAPAMPPMPAVPLPLQTLSSPLQLGLAQPVAALARKGETVGPVEVFREVEDKAPTTPEAAVQRIQSALKAHMRAAPGRTARAWRIVSSENTGVHPSGPWRENGSLLALVPGDVLVLWRETNSNHDGSSWVSLRPGDEIYRHGELYAMNRTDTVHVMVCNAEGLEFAQPWEWSDLDGVHVQTSSGFGIPWAVVHKQVIVRSRPSTHAQPLGLAVKGDVVGEGVMQSSRASSKAQQDGWVQLVDCTDVRQRESSAPEPRPFMPDSEASWMLTAHPTMGKLLRRCDGQTSLDTPGLLLSAARRGLYSRVMEVCHRRIWVDNKDTLWEGKESKIPPRSTHEAKLFNKNVTVFHARRGTGECVGGALVQQFDVKAMLLQLPFVGTVIGQQKTTASSEAEAKEFMPVGYIDCFATERGSHAGPALWAAIRRLPFCVLACHSVLTERTVEFWRSCGMHHADVESEADRKAFRDAMQLHSEGRAELLLEHLVEALPKSALPLFVWANNDAAGEWRPQADDVLSDD